MKSNSMLLMKILCLLSRQKGCGYHLDLFWVGVLMAACSFLGLPWYVAATVISIAHIDSLKMESESSAPGEQPQFLGVRSATVKSNLHVQYRCPCFYLWSLILWEVIYVLGVFANNFEFSENNE